MIHILWGLLNLVLFIFFLKTLYHAALILNKELSRFSLFILLLGLVSYACRPGNGKTEEIISWENEKMAEIENPPIGGREVLVEDGLTFTRKISYFYGKDSLGNKILAKALWSETGIQAFTQHHLKSLSILNADAIDDPSESPTYMAHVSEEWYLLGIKILTNDKQLIGKIL